MQNIKYEQQISVVLPTQLSSSKYNVKPESSHNCVMGYPHNRLRHNNNNIFLPYRNHRCSSSSSNNNGDNNVGSVGRSWKRKNNNIRNSRRVSQQHIDITDKQYAAVRANANTIDNINNKSKSNRYATLCNKADHEYTGYQLRHNKNKRSVSDAQTDLNIFTNKVAQSLVDIDNINIDSIRYQLGEHAHSPHDIQQIEGSLLYNQKQRIMDRIELLQQIKNSSNKNDDGNTKKREARKLKIKYHSFLRSVNNTPKTLQDKSRLTFNNNNSDKTKRHIVQLSKIRLSRISQYQSKHTNISNRPAQDYSSPSGGRGSIDYNRCCQLFEQQSAKYTKNKSGKKSNNSNTKNSNKQKHNSQDNTYNNNNDRQLIQSPKFIIKMGKNHYGTIDHCFHNIRQISNCGLVNFNAVYEQQQSINNKHTIQYRSSNNSNNKGGVLPQPISRSIEKYTPWDVDVEESYLGDSVAD